MVKMFIIGHKILGLPGLKLLLPLKLCHSETLPQHPKQCLVALLILL